jgi:hypothetical protein
MKTQEIIDNIEGNGSLDMIYIRRNARAEGTSVHNYIKSMVAGEFKCSTYVANRVAEYYENFKY